MSCSKSEAPSATWRCSRQSSVVAKDTLRRTMRVILSSEPRYWRATARPLRAARRAASRPVATSNSAPARPTNLAVCPSVGNIPLRNKRFPLRTASAYEPKGVGGDGSWMANAFRRSSALARLPVACKFRAGAAAFEAPSCITRSPSLRLSFSSDETIRAKTQK